MKIAVSTGNSRMDKKWNLTEMELEDLENGFPRHNVLRKQWNSIGK